MKFKGFNGYEYPLNLESKASKSSSGHSTLRKLLKEFFPLENIMEEIALPGSKEPGKKTLYADFFLPRIKLVCEVHGVQHKVYTPFFHKNKFEFYESKRRDQRKRDWCELNDIKLLEFYDTEIGSWRNALEQYTGKTKPIHPGTGSTD